MLLLASKIAAEAGWPSAFEANRTIAVGLMARLWGWAGSAAPDGSLADMPDGLIASAAGWWGEPATFVKALVEVGFLDALPDGRGWGLHDIDQHADKNTRRALYRSGAAFWNGVRARGTDLSQVERNQIDKRQRERAAELSGGSDTETRAPNGGPAGTPAGTQTGTPAGTQTDTPAGARQGAGQGQGQGQGQGPLPAKPNGAREGGVPNGRPTGTQRAPNGPPALSPSLASPRGLPLPFPKSGLEGELIAAIRAEGVQHPQADRIDWSASVSIMRDQAGTQGTTAVSWPAKCRRWMAADDGWAVVMERREPAANRSTDFDSRAHSSERALAAELHRKATAAGLTPLEFARRQAEIEPPGGSNR